MKYQDFGVYALNGPNWDRDQKTICDNFNFVVCNEMRYIYGSPVMSVQSEKFWAMNAAVKRF